MKPTPRLLRRCSLFGCEKQAHFTLDLRENETIPRVLCDKHAYAWGLAHKRLDAWNEEMKKRQPDFEKVHGIEGPSDEKPFGDLPWNYGAEDVKPKS